MIDSRSAVLLASPIKAFVDDFSKRHGATGSVAVLTTSVLVVGRSFETGESVSKPCHVLGSKFTV
jgi:hypothetical protein